ncbi:MAG: GHKL domain-containing protein [Candidatus Marinimicrobia bacterium]|nr:GHKL domain-containing protein [Candidatus Neomarinimicrobiota bacterium]
MKTQFTHYKNIISTRTLVSVFILLFMILSASAIFDYFTQRKSVIENMIHFSQMLANTVNKSTRSSIVSDAMLRQYLNKWLISELRVLDNFERTGKIDNNYLQDFCSTEHIYHLTIFSKSGNRIYYSHDDRQCSNIDSLLQPILLGKENELILGIQPFDKLNEDGYIGAIARSKGGAIVGSVKASRFSALRNIIGIEQYLNTIVSDSSIIYIAIQDSNGIIAKTNTLDSLSKFSEDTLLANLKKHDQFHWRTIKYKDTEVFEALTPLIVINKYRGTLRIGLDYSPIVKMQKTVLRQTLIRLSVLLIVSFILFSYSISIQNIQLLEKEKQKITNEVYILQRDLRHKEKMSAVGELAAGIAHEIRNPLSAISMTVQRLGREFKPTTGEAEQKRLFDIIRKEIDHIGTSIKNLLQFSKPAPLQMSPNRLEKIIDKIVDLYNGKIAAAGITLIWQNHMNVKTIIDPVKIEECLINILENAIDATPPKGIIEIGLRTTNREITISIKDTGSGISQENLSKIFNLYFTTKSNGTGLGLAHANQIVSEHGGKIRVDSQENKGTTFTIILPFNHAN